MIANFKLFHSVIWRALMQFFWQSFIILLCCWFGELCYFGDWILILNNALQETAAPKCCFSATVDLFLITRFDSCDFSDCKPVFGLLHTRPSMKLGVRILQNNFCYSLNFICDKVSDKYGLNFTGEEDFKLQEMSIPFCHVDPYVVTVCDEFSWAENGTCLTAKGRPKKEQSLAAQWQ